MFYFKFLSFVIINIIDFHYLIFNYYFSIINETNIFNFYFFIDLIIFKIIIYIYIFIYLQKWELGIGVGGLGIGDWAQSPIPNPQSPIPNPHNLKNI